MSCSTLLDPARPLLDPCSTLARPCSTLARPLLDPARPCSTLARPLLDHSFVMVSQISFFFSILSLCVRKVTVCHKSDHFLHLLSLLLMNLCFYVLFDINCVFRLLFYVFVNECAFFDRFAQQMCFFVPKCAFSKHLH